jgi:hypothetical protein
MKRFLGAWEHAFWLYDQALPVHFAMCAKISGSFSLDQLQKSLAKVQRQHPLLRVSITVTETGHPQFVEQTAPIPIRLVLREDKQDWQRELEIELSHSFDWSTAPLIRVVLLHSEGQSELIVTTYHAIAEAISIAYLIRDIVQGLESEERFDLTPLSESRPMEHLIPISERTTLPEELPSPPQYSSTVSNRPCPHVKTALLSAKLTQQLRDRARQENTTIHGAIGAAFLLTMACQRDVSLKCLSPINARSQLDPSPGETVGLFVSSGLTQHDLNENSSFWETARSLKAQLSDAMLPAQTFELVRRQQLMTASLPDPQKVYHAMQTVHDYDLVVTNLGCLPFGQQVGSLQIEALYGPVLVGEREPVVGVITCGNRLSLTVTSPSTAMSGMELDASLANALKYLAEGVVEDTNLRPSMA